MQALRSALVVQPLRLPSLMSPSMRPMPLPLSADAVLNAAPDAMLVVGARGRIELANDQSAALFGYSLDELTGMAIEELVPHRFREAHLRHREDYAQEPRTRAMGAPGLDLYGRRKDGTEFPVDISLSPLDTEQGHLVIAAVRDATLRQQAEAERVRLAMADEAVRARDEFLSVAAHELKTPLGTLQLQMQMLERLLQAGQVDLVQVLARVARATRNVARLDDLVRRLFDVSRLVTGRLDLAVEDNDLAAIVRDSAEDFREAAAQAGCELTVLGCAERLDCRCDRYRVEQVLTNLLANASKYGAGKPILVAVSASPQEARVAVRDHGMGIQPEDLQRIFGKFERGKDAIARHKGLGLGLFVSRDLVEAHGGRIEVESQPGKGATFTIHLPR